MCHLCDLKQSGADGITIVRTGQELQELFGALAAKGTPVTPEERATAEMDQQIQTALTDMNARVTTIRERNPRLLADAVGVYALTEDFAAQLMFRQDASAVAWMAAVLAYRYQELLQQWADLYVHENGSDLDDVEGLLPEQEQAVAENPRTPQPEHKTGQYL